MKKNDILALIAVAVSILVPAPGRLAYGIVLLLLLLLLSVLGTAFRFLIKKIKMDDLEPVLTAVMLVSVTVLYKQFLIMISPLTALVLGFVIYLPALSAFVITGMHRRTEEPLSAQIRSEFFHTGSFCLPALGVFLLRDIVGYGTLTLPSYGGLAELTLIAPKDRNYLGTFFASAPGALIILAIATMCVSFAFRYHKSGEESHAV